MIKEFIDKLFCIKKIKKDKCYMFICGTCRKESIRYPVLWFDCGYLGLFCSKECMDIGEKEYENEMDKKYPSRERILF